MTAAARASIEALIEGDVSGQVAVGDNIVQISNVHGGVVNVGVAPVTPTVRRRGPEQLLPPKPSGALLGRGAELDSVVSALRAGQTVEVHGPPGMGKTTLAKHAGADPDIGQPAVVYRRARRQTLDDVLQVLFEAFYEADAGVALKPVGGQLRQYLAVAAAMVVLDDLELDREDLQELIGIAPSCRFLVTAERASLFGEGLTFALRGLGEDDALALVATTLGRALAGTELEAAKALWRQVDGRPLDIIQEAGQARDEQRSLSPAAPTGGALSEADHRVLSVLAAVDGEALGRDRVIAASGVDDAAAVLASLERRGLVQSHSPSYSITTAFVPSTAAVAQLLDEFSYRSEPELDVALALLEVASRHGLWQGILRLAAATDTAMAVSGRWGTWERALTIAGQAAAQLGDRTAEGRVQHQLGVRAFCLGEEAAARVHLGEAVRIRRAVEDAAGAAISQYHLDLLGGAPPPDRPDQPPPERGPEPSARPRPGRGRLLAGVAGVAVLAAVGVGAVVVRPWDSSSPTTTVTTVTTATTVGRTTTTALINVSGTYTGSVTTATTTRETAAVKPTQTWLVTQKATTIEIARVFPGVTLTGRLTANGARFVASGEGTVASRDKVSVSFDGTITGDRAVGTLTVGANGALLGGRSITFSVDLKKA